MKMKFKIKCSKCNWETKEHYYSLDCINEKEWAHRISCSDPWEAHDMAFSSICPICGFDMGEDYIKRLWEGKE